MACKAETESSEQSVAAVYDCRVVEHSSTLQLERIEREIAATDQKIDDLTYELYAIADEQRRILEGN